MGPPGTDTHHREDIKAPGSPPPSDIRNNCPRGPYYRGSADTQTAAAADLAVSAETSSKLPLYKIRLAEDEKPDIKRRPYKAWVLLVL